MRILVAVVVVSLITALSPLSPQGPLPPDAVVAQEGPAGGGGLCFRGRPQPDCSSFLLIEFGAFLKLDPLRQGEQRYMMTFDLGWMRNVTARDALGITAFGAVTGRRSDADNAAAGLMLHYRRWLNSRSSLGLSLGTPVTGENELGDPQLPSLMTELKWNYGDLLALSTRLEHTRYRKTHFGCGDNFAGWLPSGCWSVEVPDRDTAWYVGAELGAYTGIAGILVGAAIVVLEALSNISS